MVAETAKAVASIRPYRHLVLACIHFQRGGPRLRAAGRKIAGQRKFLEAATAQVKKKSDALPAVSFPSIPPHTFYQQPLFSVPHLGSRIVVDFILCIRISARSLLLFPSHLLHLHNGWHFWSRLWPRGPSRRDPDSRLDGLPCFCKLKLCSGGFWVPLTLWYCSIGTRAWLPPPSVRVGS